MKMVSAIIQPPKLENVRNALLEVEVFRMTVTELSGYGKQKGHKEVYRGMEYEVHLNPKIRLDIIVSDVFLERTINAIEHSARSGKDGKIGDGKIFISNIEEVIRIRTGERGDNAI